MARAPAPAAADGTAAGARPAPGFFEFRAPPEWRTIDFISDLHLSEAMPRTFDAWRRHLLQTPAQAVFILGDLFEIWVGDDARDGAFARQCVEVLAEAASRRAIALMVGNRDFLLGAAMLRACGAIGLPDPTLLRFGERRLLLSHGDALCLADGEYQAFRQQVRAEAWQREFLARPLAERLAIARGLRAASASRRRFDGDPTLDVDAAEAVRWLHSQGAREMVHGHTHRPGRVELAPGFVRHVLSDWDLDDAAAPRAEVLRLGGSGLARIPPVTGRP